MTDQPEPHPRPACMECGNPLEASTTVWPLNDEGKRRHLDTGYPCGHVQLDTVLEADGETIGQLTAGQTAATIRLVAVIVGGSDRTQLLALAERVESYNGVDLCPLCTVWPHATECPLWHRTEEVIE
jgi:hypothetical protein